MKRTIIILMFWSIVISFQNGCTYNVPTIDATLPQKPLIEKIPINVGSYYSDVFQSYETVKPLPLKPDISYRFTLGTPSIALFEQIFSEMFEKVIKVSILPPLAETNDNIKAVIEPKIADVTVDADLSVTWIRVDINYAITLYDLKGAKKANWSIEGSGSSVGYLKSINHPAMVREATQLAMRNVAAKFMLSFRKNPEATKWLRSIGITTSY